MDFDDFFKACQNGDTEVVQRESHHQDLRQMLDGLTPLMVAAQYEQKICVDLLIPWSDVRQINPDGLTALLFAVEAGPGASSMAIIRALVLNSDLTHRTNKKNGGWAGEYTALILALCLNQPVTAGILIQGSDLKQANQEGWTPLILAAYKGYRGVLRRLLQGSDVQQANIRGATALHMAASNGHVKVVQDLLNAGSDPQWANNDGETAIDEAIKNHHTGVVQALIEHEAKRLRQSLGNVSTICCSTPTRKRI